MKLVPCSENELKLVRPKTDIWKALNEFAESDYEVVELSEFTHKDSHSCTSSIRTAIKRYGFSMTVLERRGRVFLAKGK